MASSREVLQQPLGDEQRLRNLRLCHARRIGLSSARLVSSRGIATTTAHPNFVGLARVSTDAQDAQLRRDALTEAGCGRIFEEKVSIRKTDRPGLAAALDYLRPGDTLCV